MKSADKTGPGGGDPVGEYIARFDPQTQVLLNRLRATIQKAAPAATEKLSYQIPTYFLNGNLVHFAAYAKHIGFYPGPSGVSAFAHKLKDYKVSKGAIQLPLDQPPPLKLIAEIVRFRVKEAAK